MLVPAKTLSWPYLRETSLQLTQTDSGLCTNSWLLEHLYMSGAWSRIWGEGGKGESSVGGDIHPSISLPTHVTPRWLHK